MSVFDTELFILQIEKEECLWKTNSKEYMVDRYAKPKAWINVASSMFDEWESFNKEEQELKEAKNSTKKYAYFDVLSFLQPVVKKRKTTGNVQNDGVSMCSIDASIIADESFEEDSPIQKDDTACHKENPTQERNKKETRITSFQSNLLNLMKNPPILQKPEENDPDKQFLLSFLPEFKKMNENQKLDFKIEFSQLVKRILNPTQLPMAEPRSLHQNDYMPNFQNPFYNQHSLPNFQTGLTQTAQIYNPSLLPTYQSPSNTYHQQIIPNNQIDIDIPLTSTSSFGENSH
ncbi:hypothetical protein ACI65C_013282 [Semiaphis heraclei]